MYAIVFMDYLTKWPEVFATSDQIAETIARLFVEQIVGRHGVPERLLSDRGANFLSSLMLEVCKLMGTTKVNTSGYHPRCDGLIEKFNVTTMLSKCVEKNGCNWDVRLPYLLYRVAMQESTQYSPFYLLYGRQSQVPTDTVLDQPSPTYPVEFNSYAEELRHGNSLTRVSRRLRNDRNISMTRRSINQIFKLVSMSWSTIQVRSVEMLGSLLVLISDHTKSFLRPQPMLR